MNSKTAEKIINKIVAFIQDTFREAGKNKAVIGISGGLDSAVVASLLVLALGEENVFGYSLPCGEQHDIKDAELVANKLGIRCDKLNIAPVVDSLKKVIGYDNDENISVGNLMARTRMIVLYDLSAFHNALVVGTSNKTELLLGYFTIYGDGACALEPIGHLYKTEVKELAKYLKIPDVIINKAPSAGLWDGQTDEKELCASYEEIDKCLKVFGGFKNNNYNLLQSVNPKDVNKKLFVELFNRIEKNKFKSELPKILEN